MFLSLSTGGLYGEAVQDAARSVPGELPPWRDAGSPEEQPPPRDAWRYSPVTCYAPLTGFHKRGGGITWSRPEAFIDLPDMVVPCGQCIGCKLERSRQWAVRIMHEAAMHEDNCFLTLTYDDEHLPADGSLRKADFQNFMKKVRKVHGTGVSYFHCGEYGDLTWRPHYHAILFGVDFRDRVGFCRGRAGFSSYTSESLQAFWEHGLATVGDCATASAAYVARYCLKKVTGDRAADHYQRITPDGEVYWLEPEYATMSKRPAIGKRWFDKYGAEVVAYDGVVTAGMLGRPPRYYDKLRDAIDHQELFGSKLERLCAAAKHKEDQTPARLKDRETVKLAAISTLKRDL